MSSVSNSASSAFIAIFASSAVGLKWFKGTATSAMENPSFENFFLPVLTIALYGMGYIARMTRSFMLYQLGQEYVLAARIKGASEFSVIWRHAFRNVLVQLITIIGLHLGMACRR